MKRSAVISPCGTWRYRLDRVWDESIRKPHARFVMLNPSTADAEKDDPTIRRCISFARSWGCGGLIVVNLFAYRATDPAELRKQVAEVAVGPDNREHVTGVMLDYDPIVVCGWGANVPVKFREYVETVVDYWIEGEGARPMCLGKTKAGHPRHPLYVPASTPLEDYR